MSLPGAPPPDPDALTAAAGSRLGGFAVPDPDALPRLDEGRYRILGFLGRGGQSVVYLAHDTALDREVAFKVVVQESDEDGTRSPIDTAARESAKARFLREARITGQLEHPHVVPVYEVGMRADGSPYCVQRLVRGRTLKAILAGSRGTAQRLELLGPIVSACQAIAFAHDCQGARSRSVMARSCARSDAARVTLMARRLA